MIQAIKNIFKKKNDELAEYKGMADFFLRAPDDLKKKVMTEAARRANEDQMKVFQEARLKTGAN